MKTKPRTNCIVCGDKIYRDNSKTKTKRKSTDVTCSKICAGIYDRISRHVKNNWKPKNQNKKGWGRSY